MSQNDGRLELYGRPCNKEDIAREVARLYLGNEDRKQQPLGVSEIATKLGYTERKSVYNYMEMASELGLLKKTEYEANGKKKSRYEKPERSAQAEFADFTKEHPILNDPIVSPWYNDLLNRKKGKGIKIAQQLLLMIERICNTTRKSPAELTESRENAEKIKDAYLTLFKEGKDKRRVKSKFIAKIETMDYTASYAIASLCGFYGISWPRGTSKMSRQIVGHAKYADVRLTDEELARADEYIITKYGIDSNMYRVFWIGVESCARNKALFNMTLEYEKHTSKKGKVTYFMTAYESKTAHIKDGKWLKYITRENTQKSIDLLKARGVNRIYETTLSKSAFDIEITNQFLDLYQYLGKIVDIEELRKKRDAGHRSTGNYFFDKPIHALRHIGAHYWLKKKKYNHSLVAVIGGWHTVDELKRSYGEIPPEIVIEMIDEDTGSSPSVAVE